MLLDEPYQDVPGTTIVARVTTMVDPVELQAPEFVAAITQGQEPNATVASVMPCYELLDRIERHLARHPGPT